jgi:hypothetical protein
MTPTVSTTLSKEAFDFIINVDVHDSDRKSVAWNDVGGIQSRGTLLGSHESVMLSASAPGPVPLGAFIRAQQVVSGVATSFHPAAQLLALAAGLTAGDLTITSLSADDHPVVERIQESIRARTLVEARLDEFSELPAGWLDGEGLAPTPAALATARALIRVLLNLNVPRPRVAPTPEGGIEAEWTLGDREVSVTFESDGGLYGNSVDVTTGELTEPELNRDDHRAVADFVLGRRA